MTWLSLPYVVPLFLSAALSAGLARYAWRQRAAVPCARALALFAAACAEYAMGYALEILAPDLALKVLLAKAEWLGLATLAPAFCVFALRYAGLDQMLSRRTRIALTATSAAMVLVVATNELHGLVWSATRLVHDGPALLLAPERGPAFWVFSAYAYGLILLSVGAIASVVLHGRGFYRRQGILLLTGLMVPLFSNLSYALDLTPVRYLNPTPMAFAFSVGVFAYAIFRFRLLEIGPVARQVVVERMHDGVLVVDAHGCIADMNPALEAALGLPALRAIGRPASEVLAPWGGLAALIAAGKEAEGELAGGEGAARREYAVSVAPMDGGKGRAGGCLVLLRDVTELRRLEAQFLQAQKMEGIGRLAGGVAHDFNNLLTAITGHATFARDALPADHPARQDLEHILKGTRRAAQLTRQLLAFARRQSLAPQPANINDLILDMAEMLGHLIGEDVELRIEPGVGLGTVRGDVNQIEQAVVNLVLNARDAMPGGGRLTIRTANVEVGERDAARYPGLAPGRYVSLAVQDTGIGLSEEVRQHLFEPFFTTKEVGKGTGLGLATVFGIVRQHQGYIQAESEPGCSATFTIYLPLVAAGADYAEPAHAAAAEPAMGGGETVLVVEDDPDVRNWAVRALRELGYVTLEARSGPEALELLERQPTLRPDLLVTDMVMPQMSGKALADYLQAAHPAMPVLFVSGYTSSAIAGQDLCYGSRAFLAKPCSQAELASRVRELLDCSS